MTFGFSSTWARMSVEILLTTLTFQLHLLCFNIKITWKFWGKALGQRSEDQLCLTKASRRCSRWGEHGSTWSRGFGLEQQEQQLQLLRFKKSLFKLGERIFIVFGFQKALIFHWNITLTTDPNYVWFNWLDPCAFMFTFRIQWQKRKCQYFLIVKFKLTRYNWETSCISLIHWLRLIQKKLTKTHQ